jgi:hypothetical protein
MKKLAAIALLAPLAFVTPLPASAQTSGVIFDIETTDHSSSSPPETMTLAVAGKNLRMQQPSQGQEQPDEMIFNGDRREMIVVNHADKSFIVMDEEMIERIVGQLGDAMSQMEAALANVPPEQRAMVEQMMRGRGMAMPSEALPKPELTRNGERATHNGYDTVRYDVLLDGRKTTELWVTDWSNIGEFAAVRPAFEAMAEFMKGMLDALAQSPMGRMAQMDTSGFEYMTEMNGFPVVTREFSESGQLEGETTLRDARRETFDPGMFEPPSGYKRQQIMGGGL